MSIKDSRRAEHTCRGSDYFVSWFSDTYGNDLFAVSSIIRGVAVLLQPKYHIVQFLVVCDCRTPAHAYTCAVWRLVGHWLMRLHRSEILSSLSTVCCRPKQTLHGPPFIEAEAWASVTSDQRGVRRTGTGTYENALLGGVGRRPFGTASARPSLIYWKARPGIVARWPGTDRTLSLCRAGMVSSPT